MGSHENASQGLMVPRWKNVLNRFGNCRFRRDHCPKMTLEIHFDTTIGEMIPLWVQRYYYRCNNTTMGATILLWVQRYHCVCNDTTMEAIIPLWIQQYLYGCNNTTMGAMVPL